MQCWYAIAYGTLSLDHFEDQEYDLLVLSTIPSLPHGIGGHASILWRKLATESGADDNDLSDSEQRLVREFTAAGIATTDPLHPARIREIHQPWFMSPLHELVNALVQRIASNHGVESILIKGPTLTMQEIRGPHHSGDVDLWVAPEHVETIKDALIPWGWTQKPDVWAGTDIFHTLTLAPPEWGCEIDIHRRFPGIGLSDERAFKEIHKSTNEAYFASVLARVPDPSDHAVMYALHCLRPEPGQSTNQTRREAAHHALRKAGERGLRSAERLQAIGALSDVLHEVFPTYELPQHIQIPRNWTWRMQPSQARYYLAGLRMTRWTLWPRVLRSIVWPAPDLLQEMDNYAGEQHSTRVGSRLARARRWVAQAINHRRR